MADLIITAASVAKTSGITINGVSGGTLTAGMALYEDTANSNVWKAANCVTSVLTSTFKGIALHASLSGQPIAALAAGGVLNIGATLTVGATYVLSETGLICPIADLASADKVTYIGYATTASSMTLMGVSTGVAVP